MPDAPRRITAPAAGVPLLDGGQRLAVLATLGQVLGQVYAHLPAKRAAYAHDPVQALALLEGRSDSLSDADFHLAVTGIVTGLRDAHTRYIGPSALRGQVAALPFLVEQHGAYDAPSFLVTKVASELTAHDPDFVPGSRLEWWNAVPFTRAVDVYADRETGGRPDSRRARALESMTFRALDYGPPPDEQWVTLGYRTGRGRSRTVELPWTLLQPGHAPTATQPGSHSGRRKAVDPAAEDVRRAKKQLFARPLWAAERAAVAAHPVDPGPRAGGRDWVPTTLQDTLAARPWSAKVGYLRIWSFDVEDDQAFWTRPSTPGAAPAGRSRRRRPRQSRRPDLGGRTAAPAVQPGPGRADALLPRRVACHPSDGSERLQPA